MVVKYKITRIGDNLEEFSEVLSEEQMGLIYDSLNEYGYEDSADDNLPSQIMSKLYNLLEF
jgi:hypothetical protein